MQALISLPDRPRRPNSFARAAFAMTQARTLGRDLSSFVPKDDEATLTILQRANVAPATTTTSGNASQLVSAAFRDYLTDLQLYSGAARLIAQAVPAALNTVTEAHYPVRVGGARAPAWVGEADAIPVVSGGFADVEIGPARKMSHILTWSREVAKRSDAGSIFSLMLREDVAAGLDAAFFATTAASAIAPAGLLYGLTSITPIGGGEEGIKSDLGQLAEAVSASGSGAVTFVMHPQKLARLRVQAPTVAAALDIAPSAAVPTDRVIAVDAASLLVGVDPEPELFTSENATIHMSDTPLELVSDAGTAADPTRSMWQTGSIALRVIHEMDFVARRTGAVAFSDGVSWW